MNTNENPLSKYFRKPGIYVQIPTGGKFNPEIEKSLNRIFEPTIK